MLHLIPVGGRRLAFTRCDWRQWATEARQRRCNDWRRNFRSSARLFFIPAGSNRFIRLQYQAMHGPAKGGGPRTICRDVNLSCKGQGQSSVRRCANSSDTPLFSGLRGKAGHEDNGAERCMAFPGERNACKASKAERRRCLTSSQILGTFVCADWAAYDCQS